LILDFPASRTCSLHTIQFLGQFLKCDSAIHSTVITKSLSNNHAWYQARYLEVLFNSSCFLGMLKERKCVLIKYMDNDLCWSVCIVRQSKGKWMFIQLGAEC
jgi:hypothetical protein